jgi:hypothetical protein
MEKTDLIRRVFEIAHSRNMRTKIDSRGHHAICFNETSGTWLHEGHIGLLFDLNILKPDITPREINKAIRSIAPGRSSAHKSMRGILVEIQSELRQGVAAPETQAGIR